MLNVAVVGAGAIAAYHIRSYAQFRDRCRVVALADIEPGRARAMNEELGLQATVHDGLDSLLQSQRIDLVSICTPPFTHRELVVRSLDAGAHVLCEKPMAPSLEDCDAMLHAQARSGKMLSVVANNRFQTPIVALREVLRSGKAGAVLHAQADSYWWRGLAYYDMWWRGTWEKEGGGCTLNHGVHHIDLFLWLAGMPESVTATLANLAHPNAEVEDYSISVLKYPAKRIGTITCSVIHHGEHQQLVFQCEKARLSFPWAVHACSAHATGFPERNTAIEEEMNRLYAVVPPLRYEGHTGQIHDVLTAIENGTPPLVDGLEGRKAIELVSAIYLSGLTGSEVRLPLGQDAPIYSRAGILQLTRPFACAARSRA